MNVRGKKERRSNFSKYFCSEVSYETFSLNRSCTLNFLLFLYKGSCTKQQLGFVNLEIFFLIEKSQSQYPLDAKQREKERKEFCGKQIPSYDNPCTRAYVKRPTTIISRYGFRFCRLVRAEQPETRRINPVSPATPPSTVTDEWNSGWPTLFRVNPSPTTAPAFPFRSPLLPTSFSLFPPLPHRHPGEASSPYSLPHYSDVITPLLTSRPTLHQPLHEDNVLLPFFSSFFPARLLR